MQDLLGAATQAMSQRMAKYSCTGDVAKTDDIHPGYLGETGNEFLWQAGGGFPMTVYFWSTGAVEHIILFELI